MLSFPLPIWLLGWASLFTDAATEMIYPLLPVYLTRVLGVGAVSLGVIEGVAEGVNSLLKVISGRASDRWGRRKPIVIAGYLLSSAARPFIAVTSTWTQVLAIRVLDRTGKGIRGAPRDAMLAGFAEPGARGRTFGFHRAMDHVGAIVGPLVATLFLLAAPGEYRTLFALTIIPGAIAVALLCFVPESAAAPVPAAGAHDQVAGGWRALPGRFYALLGILIVFSLGNSADAFLLLRLSDALGHAAYIPLLWAALHVVKAMASLYGGALSDRIGRKWAIVAGWVIYAVVYVGFAVAAEPRTLVLWFLVYGTYFGLTEGAEKALVTDLSPASLRGSAFGLYNAALGIGMLCASILFGVLYDRAGAGVAFGTGAALAGVSTLLLLALPTQSRQ